MTWLGVWLRRGVRFVEDGRCSRMGGMRRVGWVRGVDGVVVRVVRVRLRMDGCGCVGWWR